MSTKKITGRSELSTRDLAEILRIRLSAQGYRINRMSAYKVVRELIEVMGEELAESDILLSNIVRLREVERAPRANDQPTTDRRKIRVTPLGYVMKYRNRDRAPICDDPEIDQRAREEIRRYKADRGL